MDQNRRDSNVGFFFNNVIIYVITLSNPIMMRKQALKGPGGDENA